MRIALVPPLCESVPPPRYGGTERVVAWLADALVHLGHEVTLFASGDSRTSARLVPTFRGRSGGANTTTPLPRTRSRAICSSNGRASST